MKKALIVLWAAFFLPLAAQAEAQYMRVNADAEVRVKPDRAAITFGVSEKTAVLRQGAANLGEITKQVTQYLLNHGVEERFIQTDNLSITPVYSTETSYSAKGIRSDKEVLQYDISQTFTVTLEDPSRYEDVLYALLDMGINRVENVSFYSTQIRKYRDDARKLAVKHAQEKAALLAEAAGVKLGKPVNVQEEAVPSWGYPRYAASNVSQNVYTSAASAGDDLNPAPATGLISVKAAVTLTYKIK